MLSLPQIILISAASWFVLGLIAWLIFCVWRHTLSPKYYKCIKAVLFGPISFYILYCYELKIKKIKKILNSLFGEQKINTSDFKG